MFTYDRRQRMHWAKHSYTTRRQLTLLTDMGIRANVVQTHTHCRDRRVTHLIHSLHSAALSATRPPPTSLLFFHFLHDVLHAALFVAVCLLLGGPLA